MLAVPTHDPSEPVTGPSLADHNTATRENGVDRTTNLGNAVDVTNTQQKLVLWQGIALLTADCMGVGVLGLPNDIKVLGWVVGIAFLVGNLPINYYAGNLLSLLALDVEQDGLYQPAAGMLTGPPTESVTGPVGSVDGGKALCDDDDDDDPGRTSPSIIEVEMTASSNIGADGLSFPAVPFRRSSHPPLHPVEGHQPPSSSKHDTSARKLRNVRAIDCTEATESSSLKRHHEAASKGPGSFQSNHDDGHTNESQFDVENFHDEDDNDGPMSEEEVDHLYGRRGTHDDQVTSDLINISDVVFGASTPGATHVVRAVYYTNLFLVLGDYILVMGRSVSAVFLDQICLPSAGIVATILMFGLCQYRSMANLGRSLSLASLLALLIVLIQCLFHHHKDNGAGRRMLAGGSDEATTTIPTQAEAEGSAGPSDGAPDGDSAASNDIWGKFSSLAGIGFAVGSQKLFLNIRHELRDREEAPQVLAGSLTCYGLAYVVVILLAGPGTCNNSYRSPSTRHRLRMSHNGNMHVPLETRYPYDVDWLTRSDTTVDVEFVLSLHRPAIILVRYNSRGMGPTSCWISLVVPCCGELRD
jgi:hypothetical protein